VDVDRFRLSDSIVIDRPPEAVYAIVSDVTRMGELSPVCRQVAAAEPGREFTFVNHGREGETKLVRWSYTFASHGDGTVVTESWQVLPAYPDFVLAGNPDADVAASIQGMADLARAGITETLGNLKRVAEA
jgi:Polyketide cyclase / dehydrase and lipid transport